MHEVSVRIDRVQVASWAGEGWKAPRLKGFKVKRDSFVRSQTSINTYERVREYHSKKNDAKVYWQYWPRQGWLARWKITLVADDHAGLRFQELDAVLRHCKYWRFLLIEVAIDFSPSTGVNKKFVRRHAVFGKSQRATRKKGWGVLYWGSRKSEKFVRCYKKRQLKSYRVEVELHSPLLRGHQINRLDDFDYVAEVIYPQHFRFVDVNWDRLKRHLNGKHHGRALVAGAKKRAPSLSRLRYYLRRKGITNFHRFLTPLAINRKIDRAFDRWTGHFEEGSGVLYA
jgi:hypothetical protein